MFETSLVYLDVPDKTKLCNKSVPSPRIKEIRKQMAKIKTLSPRSATYRIPPSLHLASGSMNGHTQKHILLVS